MPVRGFCEHGKVWTTCTICGKDVIASQAGKRSDLDDWGDVRPKKKVVKTIPEEPPEDFAGEES
jgi:hypothetical protein